VKSRGYLLSGPELRARPRCLLRRSRSPVDAPGVRRIAPPIVGRPTPEESGHYRRFRRARLAGGMDPRGSRWALHAPLRAGHPTLLEVRPGRRAWPGLGRRGESRLAKRFRPVADPATGDHLVRGSARGPGPSARPAGGRRQRTLMPQPRLLIGRCRKPLVYFTALGRLKQPGIVQDLRPKMGVDRCLRYFRMPDRRYRTK
jgi:hypothetical protein